MWHAEFAAFPSVQGSRVRRALILKGPIGE
jgi:hypothetical protein